MATIQNVIDSSIARYQDPDKTLWADAELLAYANKAVAYLNQLLIQRNDPIGLSSIAITTSDGTETYALPSGFIAMYPGKSSDQSGMWIDDNFLWPVRETEKVNYSDDEGGEPKYYYIIDGYIGLLPVPDDEYQVNYRYFATQNALELSTPSTMPWGGVFDEAISMFMTSLANARGEMDVSMITQVYAELERSALSVVSLRTPIRVRMNPRLKARRR